MLIRDVRKEDIPRLLEIYDYYVKNTSITFEYDTPTEAEFLVRIESITRRYPYLVIEEEEKVIGYAYAGVFKNRAAYDWSCELSIYLDRECRGRGYGRRLYEELEKRLKEAGMQNLYACIASPIKEDEYLTNDSEKFHTRLGFTKVGEFHKCGFKFQRWYNMIWMEKIIGEHTV